jgi:hypothetical protein
MSVAERYCRTARPATGAESACQRINPSDWDSAATYAAIGLILNADPITTRNRRARYGRER